MLLGLMMTLVALLLWLDGRVGGELQLAKARIELLPHVSWGDSLL